MQDCNFSLVISELDDYVCMRNVVVGQDETDQLSEATPNTTAAIVPELSLRYMVTLLNSIAIAMRNPISMVRGNGRDDPEGKFTTFTLHIY